MRRRLPSKEPSKEKGGSLAALTALIPSQQPSRVLVLFLFKSSCWPPSRDGSFVCAFLFQGKGHYMYPFFEETRVGFCKAPLTGFFKGIPPSLRIHVSLLRIGYKKSLFCLYPVRCPPHGFF